MKETAGSFPSLRLRGRRDPAGKDKQMILLALDTSGPVCGTALTENGAVRYEAVVKNDFTHSRNLMPMVEEACLRSGIPIEKVDLFACTVGPGSFTGVRLGVEAAKAMAHALSRQVIPVDALEAFAEGHREFEGLVLPMQDARAKQVYAALFEGGTLKRLTGDMPAPLEDVLDMAAEYGKRVLATGDGAAVHCDEILAFEKLKGRVSAAGCADIYLRPACVAGCALRNLDGALDWKDLEPMYLRPPQAERQKNLRETGHE